MKFQSFSIRSNYCIIKIFCACAPPPQIFSYLSSVIMMQKHIELVRTKTKPDLRREIDAVVKLLQMQRADGTSQATTPRDVAYLLHALGDARECARLLDSMHPPTGYGKAHLEIVAHLRSLIGKPVAPISSRVVYVEVSASNGPITFESLRRLFPNMSKVWRVLVSPTKLAALLEFASHSSARRAVDSRQQVGYPNAFPESRCAWISPSIELPPMDLDRARSFPIFEIMNDESLFCPSTDWRRPRPTLTKLSDLDFSPEDLVRVLQNAGAFDDYPADVNQLIF